MPAEQHLKQEIAALQHELRRVCDALERNSSHALERQKQQLTQNISLCEHQLKQATLDKNNEDHRTQK